MAQAPATQEKTVNIDEKGLQPNNHHPLLLVMGCTQPEGLLMNAMICQQPITHRLPCVGVIYSFPCYVPVCPRPCYQSLILGGSPQGPAKRIDKHTYHTTACAAYAGCDLRDSALWA